MVHNGIVENYEDLISSFLLDTNKLESETDTEIVAEIYSKLLTEFDPIEALMNLTKNIQGTYAFAFLVKGSNSIYAVRKGILENYINLKEHENELIKMKYSDINVIESNFLNDPGIVSLHRVNNNNLSNKYIKIENNN